MKKETGFAIFLGIAFGLGVSLFTILKTKDTQIGKSRPLTNVKKTAPVAMTVDALSQNFKITQPNDKQIVSSKSIAIKGEAEKGSLIIIQSPIKDIAVKLEKAQFSIDFPLALGENVINLSAYPADSKGRSQQKELRVYYLDEQ